MAKKEVTNAVCVECGRPVEARANIGGMISQENGIKRRFLFNHIYTYWHCEDHGAVWAYIDGELVTRPSHLFDSFDFDDWGVEVCKDARSQRESDSGLGLSDCGYPAATIATQPETGSGLEEGIL